MKHINVKFHLLSVLTVLALILTAFTPAVVSASADTSSQTIVQIAVSNPRLSTLVAAVQAAGLVDTLNSPGPFTVFAPTNRAFNRLGKSTIDALLKDPATLKSILLYHVASGKLMAQDVVKLNSITMVDGLPTLVRVKEDEVRINNASIIISDIQASNGVIHVIDAVLLPPTKDIVDTAASDPQFSTLVAAVQTAGLVDALKGAGPFTVFAPTNNAFTRLGQSTIDALLKDPATLKNILLYHVLGSEVFSADAAKAGHATTLNGQDVVITSRRGWFYRNGQLFVNNARVVMRDILTTNGVIHAIDAVLLPPGKDIVDTLSARPEFSTLVAAVQAAGLVDTLKSAGPFTIFAPTNEAFENLPKGTLQALLKDPATLKSILLYHAVSGRVYSVDARKLTSATTINGAALKIHLEDRGLFINNAKVIRADILATNGVIHGIDAVLIPPK